MINYTLLVCSYHGTPKMRKVSSSVAFPKIFPIVSSIDTFNYYLTHFLCDFLSLIIPDVYSCKDTSRYFKMVTIRI